MGEYKEGQPSYGLLDRIALKQKLDHKETFHLWNTLAKKDFKPDVNIPGSQWVPAETLTKEIAATKAKKDDMIVVYCGGGQCLASKAAAEKLVSWGYNKVFTYEGGLQDWKAGGLPLANLQ